MKSEDYAWNTHERECYENGQVSLPSPYKIKILDDGQKRLELEQILAQLPQQQLAQAVATAHMRGHAIVSADYAVKVLNLQSPDDTEAVRKEREKQIGLATKWQKCINEI